jgi:histidyl-tRNA synthetase
MNPLSGGYFISEISAWLEAWGYRYVEIPTLAKAEMFESCTEGTDNRMFGLDNGMVLVPEVTNYIRGMGTQRLGTDKVYYVARCFRNENTTDSERLREFTQIGVELLMDNALDARKVTRRDAIKLFRKTLPSSEWKLEDGVERGLNLYDDSGKTFEISSTKSRKQILGGGPYGGGAGWALGLERLMIARK